MKPEKLERLLHIYLGLFPFEVYTCSTCLSGHDRGSTLEPACFNKKVIKKYGDKSVDLPFASQPCTIPEGDEKLRGCRHYEEKVTEKARKPQTDRPLVY